MRFGSTAILITLLLATHASAANLFDANHARALVSDQRAHQIGDTLTVMIYEATTASNSAQESGSKTRDLSGNIGLGQVFNEAGKINLQNDFSGKAKVERSGSILAQMSVTVSDTLPNGDLRVVGEHSLKINGEKTKIKVHGRVRPIDISDTNSIPSYRLADAEISYDGNGFVTRSAKPGLTTRIFNWLGLW